MREKADAFLVRQPKKDPNSVTKCEEWKSALESCLETYVKDKGSKPPVLEVATFTVEVLRVSGLFLRETKSAVNPKTPSSIMERKPLKATWQSCAL